MATTKKPATKSSSATAKKPVAPATAGKPTAAKTATKTVAKATPAKAAPKPAAKIEAPAVSKTPASTKVTKAPKIAKTPLDTKQRHHYVEVAAYFMAERRGFMTGCESEDWLAAEAEIDRLFHEGKLNA